MDDAKRPDVFHKLARSDGWDLYTGNTINYRRLLETGEPARPLKPNGTPALCTPTVVHAAREPRSTFSGLPAERRGLDQLTMFEVAGLPVVESGGKQGFRELRVLRELPASVWQEMVYGSNLRERLDEARGIITRAKAISWLQPQSEVDVDVLQALAAEHIEALVPWQRTGTPTLRVLPVRVLTDRQDALRLAAAASNARWVASAAAYDAAAASAARAAAAADRICPNLRWYVRPDYVIYRCWRWEVAMGGKSNPWRPLLEFWSLGVLPLGLHDGEYLIWVPPIACGTGAPASMQDRVRAALRRPA